MRKLIWHEVEQGSAQWFDLRRGKITSSTCHPLLVDPPSRCIKDENGKYIKGDDGKNIREFTDILNAGAWSLVYQLAGEIVTKQVPVEFDTYATERGKSLEPIALQEYSEKTWQNFREVGFVELSQFAGTSPDGIIVGESKGVEIKCLMHKEHMRIIDTGPDKAHVTQCQWHMFILGWDSWDLVYYHPQAINKSLLIYELKKDEETHDKFKSAYETCANEIQRLVALCSEPAKELV